MSPYPRPRPASDDELRRAADPSTPPAELRALAAIHPQVAALVAANPNTPLDLLPDLAVLHAEAVARNPALDLYALDPTPLLTCVTMAAASALAECERAPIFLLSILARSHDFHIRTIVARTPRCPEETLLELTRDEHEQVREHARRNLARRAFAPGEGR